MTHDRGDTQREVDWNRPPFLYTLDQVAQVVNMNEMILKRGYINFWSPGELEKPDSRKMVARNIGDKDNPEWRITDSEFHRWLKVMGFKPVAFWAIY